MQSIRAQARRLTVALYNIDEVYFDNAQKQAVKGSELCLMYALDDGRPHSQREIVQEWLIPKTTLNTIVKQWEREGLLELSAIPGKRRERAIRLTEAGRQHAEQALAYLYRVEERAVARTMERYSAQFIDAIEYFGVALKEAFEEEENRAKAGETP